MFYLTYESIAQKQPLEIKPTTRQFQNLTWESLQPGPAPWFTHRGWPGPQYTPMPARARRRPLLQQQPSV